MRAVASPIARALSLLTVLLVPSVLGVTLEELQTAPDLTPQKFARYFRNFSYQYRAEIQDPQVFLMTETGDCDDYATLAASVLRARGYTPRLITVRMPNLIHVVCYIEETKSYLDYNNRSFFLRTVSCGGAIDEIAAKVAKASGKNWVSASEFTYDAGVKRLVKTVLESNPTERRIAGFFK